MKAIAEQIDIRELWREHRRRSRAIRRRQSTALVLIGLLVTIVAVAVAWILWR